MSNNTLNFSNKIININSIILEINQLTSQNIGAFHFFEDIQEKDNTPSSFESQFWELVIYLYGVYFERSRINMDFVINFLEDEELFFTKQHKITIHSLRTYYTHNLSKNERNKKVKKTCLNWLLGKNLFDFPSEENDWKILSEEIHNETSKTLNIIKRRLESLIADADFNFILNEWIIKKNKDYPDYKLVEFCATICKNYSLNLDPDIFIKTHNSKIREKLSIALIEDQKSFDNFLNQIIEELIFTSNQLPCPIVWDDIVEHFNAEVKLLGEIKKFAITLSSNDPYTNKEKIIEKLRSQYKEYLR